MKIREFCAQRQKDDDVQRPDSSVHIVLEIMIKKLTRDVPLKSVVQNLRADHIN